MKNLLFFLLFSNFVFGQNFSKDTLLVDGTQPATILKIKSHKIFIAQNKELQTPYKLQKDGSFVSDGVPNVQVSIRKSSQGVATQFINYLFENDQLKAGETKEIIQSNDKSVFVKKRTINQILIIESIYPMNKDILSIHVSVAFKDEDDKTEKFYQIRDILEKGILILEDYYQYRKE